MARTRPGRFNHLSPLLRLYGMREPGCPFRRQRREAVNAVVAGALRNALGGAGPAQSGLNIRPVQKPFRVGIDRGGDHSICIPT